MIDTHCHLTFPELNKNVPELLASAAAAGVTGAITISTTTLDCLDALAVARAHERVWCTAGVHPLYADVASERAAKRSGASHAWESLRTVASDPKCVAWGELGLDKHYDTPVQSVQRAVLDEQLAFIRSVNHAGPGGIGKARGLPIVIHCREAFDDLIPVMKQSGLDVTRLVFHCFTGTRADMQQILDLGAMVSFTGVVTYPNTGELREAVKMAPAERIMVETDAPFLSPAPHRGKRPCVPAYTALTLKALAEIRGEREAELHETVNRNTARFFGVEAR